MPRDGVEVVSHPTPEDRIMNRQNLSGTHNPLPTPGPPEPTVILDLLTCLARHYHDNGIGEVPPAMTCSYDGVFATLTIARGSLPVGPASGSAASISRFLLRSRSRPRRASAWPGRSARIIVRRTSMRLSAACWSVAWCWRIIAESGCRRLPRLLTVRRSPRPEQRHGTEKRQPPATSPRASKERARSALASRCRGLGGSSTWQP